MKGYGRKNSSSRLSGYFTVEATLIISFVLGVIVLVIYLMFFQYNRCLTEQDAGVLLLRSSTVQIRDKKQLVVRLKREEQQIYFDKYIAWEMQGAIWEMQGNKRCVKQKGAMKYPFAGAGSLVGELFWQADAVYEYEYISPITLLRVYRKVSSTQKQNERKKEDVANGIY